MLTKLHWIFIASIPVFILHGTEEYMMGFFRIDPVFLWVFQPVLRMPADQASFLIFQIMLWLLLIVSALLLLGKRWQRCLLVIPGIIYILEMHHLIEAIMRQSYYPGSITAIAFPVLAFFFWKEYPHSSASSNS